MNFLQSVPLALTPLSPIHIGCGEEFDPTNYLIEDGTLYAFDPSRARLPDSLAKELGGIGERANLLAIQRFFREHREYFKPHAEILIPVAPGLAAEYERQLGNVANREANGRQVINQLAIERASHSNGLPYIPGSSFKGALRTGILDRLNEGRPPLAGERGSRPNTWDSAKIETRLLQGDFATSPLRLVKPGDLMPAGEIARQVLYAINLKKDRVLDKHGRDRKPHGTPSRKECIVAGQYRGFVGGLTLHHLGQYDDPKLTPAVKLRQTDLARIAQDSNSYHLPRLEEEIRMLDRRGFVDPEWKEAVENLIQGELQPLLHNGRAFLVRLGRFGGADSKTLSGNDVAQIKIMEGEGPDGKQRWSFQSHTKTVWLAANHAQDSRHLLPFGWALVEIDPQGDLPRLHSWCEAQAGSRPDMNAVRTRFAAAKAEAAQREEQRNAEREAARLAEQLRLAKAAEKAQQIANLSPAQREIEAFKEAFSQRAELLRGKQDRPHTDYYLRARKLAEAAAGWNSEERLAAVQAIEQWVPKVIAIDVKDLRKKLGLAALREMP